jgi:hypothetical protein
MYNYAREVATTYHQGAKHDADVFSSKSFVHEDMSRMWLESLLHERRPRPTGSARGDDHVDFRDSAMHSLGLALNNLSVLGNMSSVCDKQLAATHRQGQIWCRLLALLVYKCS